MFFRSRAGSHPQRKRTSRTQVLHEFFCQRLLGFFWKWGSVSLSMPSNISRWGFLSSLDDGQAAQPCAFVPWQTVETNCFFTLLVNFIWFVWLLPFISWQHGLAHSCVIQHFDTHKCNHRVKKTCTPFVPLQTTDPGGVASLLASGKPM